MTLNAVLFVAVLSLAACGARPAPALTLATTTSVGNSGLLDLLLPAYPVTVHVLQVGSGRALAMLESREADVAITHAPELEAELLKRHSDWFYRKFLYNDFLIAGPPDDPAGIAGTRDPVEAMKRIIQTGQRFVSRGDDSGTHERERQLWQAAALPTASPQIVVAGAGMGQTIRIASNVGAYTLTDRGTFTLLSSSLQMRELVSGDPRLLNTYAVIATTDGDGGEFARWLAEGPGREHLAAALNAKQVRGFTIWPREMERRRPDARPF